MAKSSDSNSIIKSIVRIIAIKMFRGVVVLLSALVSFTTKEKSF